MTVKQLIEELRQFASDSRTIDRALEDLAVVTRDTDGLVRYTYGVVFANSKVDGFHCQLLVIE